MSSIVSNVTDSASVRTTGCSAARATYMAMGSALARARARSGSCHAAFMRRMA